MFNMICKIAAHIVEIGIGIVLGVLIFVAMELTAWLLHVPSWTVFAAVAVAAVVWTVIERREGC